MYSRLANSEVLGHVVEVYERSAVRKDGANLTFRLALAPAINCMPLQSVLEVYQSGKLSTRSEQLAESVLIAEPDPSYFVIPHGYRELSPSEIQRDDLEFKTGRPVPESLMDQWRKRDQRYQESRKFQ
jgi:hypothetical protein